MDSERQRAIYLTRPPNAGPTLPNALVWIDAVRKVGVILNNNISCLTQFSFTEATRIAGVVSSARSIFPLLSWITITTIDPNPYFDCITRSHSLNWHYPPGRVKRNISFPGKRKIYKRLVPCTQRGSHSERELLVEKKKANP